MVNLDEKYSVGQSEQMDVDKGKQKHWFLELSKMVGWSILIVLTFILYTQFLPVFLLGYGQVMVLLGSPDKAPSVVDAMIFIPTAIGLSGLITYGYYRILVKQRNRFAMVKAKLVLRYTSWRLERKEKRELKKSKK